MLNFFFSFEGRIRRSSYFLGAVGACFVWSVLAVSSLASLNIDIDEVANYTSIDWNPSPVAILFGMVIGFLALWSALALTVKRWHDVGATGWFSLLSLPPFANFAMFLLLCLLPGNEGANRFGSNPRQDDLLATKAAPTA
jgi:uncharacterized membrane protein YhaH (DUF805 family)